MGLRKNEFPVSVVIPAFNAEGTIEKCLQALAAQSLPATEIIVVDDGSHDRTPDLAKPWARVISHSVARGPGAARNAGARQAAGDIIAFIDSDCIAPSDWLKKIVQAFENTDVGAVGGGYDAGVDATFWQEFCWRELAFRRRGCCGQVATLVSNNMACRKDVFWQAGGFPTEYPVCEDMLLSHRISLRHKVWWLADNGVTHHFKNSLRDFLRHQFFFGAESTRFFLQNPQLLAVRNHQPKSLYLAVLAALGMVLFGGMMLVFVFMHRSHISQLCGLLLAGSFFLHLILYIPFLQFLRSSGFRQIGRAYVVSWLRDLTVSLSFFDGCRRVVLLHWLHREKTSEECA